MLLHLASWYPKKYCLTCLLGIPVLPAKKGKNPLPNQLNQCNELIKGEKYPSLYFCHYLPCTTGLHVFVSVSQLNLFY